MFKEFMTFTELSNLVKSGSLELITMRINDWFVKGQYATFVSFANGRQFPTCNYICVESGKDESVWKFNKELFC